MRWLFFVLIISCFAVGRAQNLDSLWSLIKNKQLTDSSRVLTLAELAYEIRRSKPDSSLLLAQQAFFFASRIKYDKGKGRALRVIGIHYYLQSDYTKAMNFFQQALDLALRVNDRKNIADCYNNVGTIYHARTDYKNAVAWFSKSLRIREEIGDLRGIAQAHANLATVYEDEGNLDLALTGFQKSLEIYERIDDKEGIASSYRNIGTVYRSTGNSKKALQYFLISLEKRKEVRPDQHGVAFLYNDLGSIYKEQGNYEKALQYFFEALKIQEAAKSKQGMAASYNNIGNIYKDQGNYDKALEYLISSKKIKEEIGSRIGIANSYSEIGSLHMERNELEKAKEDLTKSLAIREEVGDKRGVAQTCARLADLFIKTKEYAAALALLEKGLNIAQEVKADILLCNIYIVYARYFNATEKYALAYNYARSAYDLSMNVSNIEFQRDAAEQKSIAAERLGKYKEALENHKLFLNYNDSVQNLNSVRKSLALEYMFKEEKSKIEGEKKELLLRSENEQQKRIAYTLGVIAVMLVIICLLIYRNNLLSRRANKILKLQKHEIELAHNELEKSDSIKNRLLSIISHDVRGPLNSLRAILYLFESKHLTEAELKEMTVNIGDQVGQLNFFLDNLLRWTKNQSSNVTPHPQNLDTAQIVKEVIDLLMFNARTKNIAMETEIASGLLIYADEEMIKLVLRNLVANAIKFCRKNDSIRIRASIEDGMAKVEVTDTGMGIAEKDLPRLFGMMHLSTKGTRDEIGTGLGLALCKEFVEKNGGKISVKSQLGQGSVFQFTVPLPPSTHVPVS